MFEGAVLIITSTGSGFAGVITLIAAGLFALVAVRLFTGTPSRRPTRQDRQNRQGRQGRRSRRNRRRQLLIAAEGLLVTLLVLGFGTHTEKPAAPATSNQSVVSELPTTGQPAPSATDGLHPRPVLGEGRTADPCGLLDAAALEEFGDTTIEPRYGNFNGCDVIVTSPGAAVDVRVQFEHTERGAGDTDGLTVVPGHQDGRQCTYTLLLTDHNQVVVTATLDHGRARLCRITQRASATAERVLRNTGEVPRRTDPPDPDSLSRMDACTLLRASTVSDVLGAPAKVSRRGFAGWECDWTSGATPTTVFLRFDQDSGLDDSDGQRVSPNGRLAYVQPKGDGDDTCVARVPHRTYFAEDGEPVVELVFLLVTGPQSTDQLCAQATRLAGALRL